MTPPDFECRDLMEHLADYLKQEITPELADEIRRHLQRCRACDDAARIERKFLHLLEQQLERQQCPPELRARILDSLRQAKPAPPA